MLGYTLILYHNAREFTPPSIADLALCGVPLLPDRLVFHSSLALHLFTAYLETGVSPPCCQVPSHQPQPTNVIVLRFSLCSFPFLLTFRRCSYLLISALTYRHQPGTHPRTLEATRKAASRSWPGFSTKID